MADLRPRTPNRCRCSYQFALTSASCIQNNPNPLVIVGAAKENCNINGNTNPPQWPELNSLASWPNARTTYASYVYPGWTPGGDFDFALLILDQQSKAAADGNCTSCIKMTASKPVVGTKYTAMGLGSAGSMTDGNPQPNLKEALLTAYDTNKCIADRNAPTTNNPFVKKFWKQRFGNPKFTIQSSFCTTTDKASAAGLCNLDGGSPLVSKGASVAEDKLMGVGAAVTASCNSYYDPQVWVDITSVANWVQGIMKVVTPKLNATKQQVPSNDPPPAPAVTGLKPIYSYSMRVTLANPGATPGTSKTTAIPCGAGDSDISFAEVGATMAATISARILRKKYFPDKPGQFSPCGVLPVSCKVNTTAGETVIKFEWSSGKDPVTMNAWFNAGPNSALAGDDIGFFSPVNDPDYASGLVVPPGAVLAVHLWDGAGSACVGAVQAAAEGGPPAVTGGILCRATHVLPAVRPPGSCAALHRCAPPPPPALPPPDRSATGRSSGAPMPTSTAPWRSPAWRSPQAVATRPTDTRSRCGPPSRSPAPRKSTSQPGRSRTPLWTLVTMA
ncbi:hypothetical protein ABPG75_010316 [Micractinium tetrahymenae]